MTGRPPLTANQADELRPHIVNLREGRLSGNGEVSTTPEDVEAIFGVHLPAFVAEHGGAAVPVLLYAHGGLVDEGAGLSIAHRQVQWWKSNGVYPIHFVWETGLAGAVTGALRNWFGGRTLRAGERTDRLIERAARLGRGAAIWDQMKGHAQAASEPHGGALLVAEALGKYCTDSPRALSVHAAGHSAGAIFHSHFIPAALTAGVPEFAGVNFLAPALRVDAFKERLAPEVGRRIGALAMFAMNRELELKDTFAGVYGKSLLHLIGASLEAEEAAPVLGLQECVQNDPLLRRFFGIHGTGAPAEAVWSVTSDGPLKSRSTARSHDAFDNDQPTMDSLARRITGTESIRPYNAACGSYRAG